MLFLLLSGMFSPFIHLYLTYALYEITTRILTI